MPIEEKQLKSKRFVIKLILMGVLIIAGGLAFVWFALYPLRNTDRFALAIRFVKNNATIKTQIGEITGIEGFGLTQRNRLQENAEKLRRAKESFGKPENTESNTDAPKIRRVTPEEAKWNSATLTGTLKTMEIKVRLKEKNMGRHGRRQILQCQRRAIPGRKRRLARYSDRLAGK